MKIIKLDATASTNDYINDLSRKVMSEDGLVVVANHQTQGKGQRGNQWFSESYKSLTFSVLKRFDGLDIQQVSMVHWAVSIAIKTALEDMGIPNIYVKWPNDILTGTMKICGILIENSVKSTKIDSSIVGIGINVNNTSFPGLPKATSMLLSTGATYQIDEVLEKICTKVLSELKDLETKDQVLLKELYEEQLFKKNLVSVFEDTSGVRFNGIIQGVTQSGELKIEMDNGKLRVFQLKEVQLLY